MKEPNNRLTPSVRQALKDDIRNGLRRKDLAKKYGVSQATITYHAQRTRTRKLRQASHNLLLKRTESQNMLAQVFSGAARVERLTDRVWLVRT